MFERARDLDLTNQNPAKEISRPLGYQADPHRPWSHEELEFFPGNCRPVWRRAVIVLLYTGLRREDAINLQRRHIVDDRIYLSKDRTGDTIRKTGAEVVIPIHPRLAEELSTPLPIEGLTLITGTHGRPIRGDVLTNPIRKEAKRLGITTTPSLHGLRKNAAMRLFEIGCSVEEIHAIAGQSHQMIHLFSQAYNRDHLVDSLVVKIECDRTEKQ